MNVERQFNRMTFGIKLTKRQAETVKKQLSVGKTPTLVVNGIKLTLPELYTVQDLLRKQSRPHRATTRARYEEISPTRVRVNDSVVLTKNQVKQYQNLVKSVNRFIEKQQFVDTALRVKYLASQSDRETQYYPAMAAARTFMPKSTSLRKIKSRDEYYDLIKYYKRIYNPKNQRSVALKFNWVANKQNWLKAYTEKADDYFEQKVYNAVARMPVEEYRFLVASGALPHPGEIYAGNYDLIIYINEFILGRQRYLTYEKLRS